MPASNSNGSTRTSRRPEVKAALYRVLNSPGAGSRIKAQLQRMAEIAGPVKPRRGGHE